MLFRLSFYRSKQCDIVPNNQKKTARAIFTLRYFFFLGVGEGMDKFIY